MIKPTIGRVLWYTPSGREPDNFTYHGQQKCECRITYVWNDRMVNLCVSDHNGAQFPMTSVNLVQPGEERPVIGTAYCEWMPFQVGQAAQKT